METFPDGLKVFGGRNLKGAKLPAFGDHRVAMSFAVGAMGATGDSEIEGAEVVGISYPEFFSTLGSVSRG